MELQTMPLRFRVWDKEEKNFLITSRIQDGYEIIKFEQSVSEIAALIDKFGKDRLVISQDTGLKDKNEKSIYMGDILQWGRDIGYVTMFQGQVVLEIVTLPSRTHLLYCIHKDVQLLGNIWQDSILLEGEKQ